MWMGERLVHISAFSEIQFLYDVNKTPLRIFSECTVQGYLILLVLIDNCVAFFVNVHAPFVLNGGLALTTLNKETSTTFMNLQGAFIYFIL